VALEEIREDARDQRLETRVEPFIGGVKLGMAHDKPPGIPDPQPVQHHIACRNRPLRLPPSAEPWRPRPMGINSESDTAASLQIGPTTLGMVRIYLEGDGIDLPLDFDPEEAEEIAEELRAAAAAARKVKKKR
jgi:hypothetical protein